jgi:hypothetical protein
MNNDNKERRSHMKLSLFPIRLAALAAAVSAIGAVGTASLAPAGEEKQHASSLTAKLTLLDGKSRTVALEGVGCTSSICSRVSVDSRKPGDPVVTKTWLDSILAIKDVTKDDALFVFRDGTQRRLSVIPLNRVLYIKSQSSRDEKINLATVRSLEFIPSSSR